jgi:hypothetical protein
MIARWSEWESLGWISYIEKKAGIKWVYVCRMR